MSSAIVLLSTRSPQLLTEWRSQCKTAGLLVDSSTTANLRAQLAQPGAKVWVADVADPNCELPTTPGVVRILVGERQSVVFEEFRRRGMAPFFLGYDESRTKLRPTVDIASQMAELAAENEMLRERWGEAQPQSVPLPEPAHEGEDWKFPWTAVATLNDRSDLLALFQREARAQLGAVRASLHVRDGERFVSLEGDAPAVCYADSPMVGWLEERPSVIDLQSWNPRDDPRAEMQIRSLMAATRTSLLVPLLLGNRLGGWLAFGPPAVGSSYTAALHQRAVSLARFVEVCLEREAQLSALRQKQTVFERWRRVLPRARLLAPGEADQPDLPVAVRAVVGEVAHRGGPVTKYPTDQSPLHVEAGLVDSTREVWVQWSDCSEYVTRQRSAAESTRRDLLGEVMLLLQHELGNRLTGLSAAVDVVSAGQVPPPAVMQSVANDLGKLGELKLLCGTLNGTSPADFRLFDLRDVGDLVRASAGLKVIVGDDPIKVIGNRGGLGSAILAIASASGESSAAHAGGDGPEPQLEISRRGEGANALAILTLRGVRTVPHGLTDANPDALAHAELRVFIAREVIVRHGGSIYVTPGIRGSDILVTLPGCELTQVGRPSASTATVLEIPAPTPG